MLLLDRPEIGEGPEIAASLADGAAGSIAFVGCDLNRLAEAEAAIQGAADGEGGIDILINNAALIINRPFEEFSLTEYEDQIRVNSSAAFAMARACAPGMKAKGYGKIVNFCSLTLNGRWDGYVPYVASKGAMLGLTKSLARELGPHGIRVNAVSPGAVVSEAEERVFGERLKQYNDWVLENQSLKSRIEPEDVASLVLFLVSPCLRHDQRPEHRHRRRLVSGDCSACWSFATTAPAWSSLPEQGGGIARFDALVAGQRCGAAQAAAGRCIGCELLVPWSNRISGGGFEFDGRFHAVAPNVPGEPFPLHGDGFQKPWRVARQTATEAELVLDDGSIGPYRYAACVSYALHDGALEATLAVENRAADPLALRPRLPSLAAAPCRHVACRQG